MFKDLLSLFALASAFSVAGAQSDYLNATPPTIYEAEEMSPQNMDFDSENNMFVAHAGWYKDHLVHYYKFRIFAPVTYPGVVEPGSTSAAVPLQKVYIVTDSGDFTGMIGMPIIEYHTQDGLMYSDFMTVTFVEAPTDYVEGTFKSTGDIMASGATLFETDIVLNLPVVPTGSTLQHPIEMGTSKAPINPIPVYYRGVEVWTYLFEVTDQAAADAFASTRSPDVSPERQEGETTGFEIPVVSFATSERVSAIPLWHVNQFRNGVMEGNGGGPDPMGMRNVIDMDRPDPGYSPLWQLYWATETPINFTADEFSNAAQGTSSNGFMFFETPMFVNCPDIGMVGEESNPLKAEEFMSMIYLDSGDSFMIIGSDASLIMTADVEVTLMADDGTTTLATVLTGMLGGYEFSIMKDDIPEGTMELMVMVGEETIRSIEVEDMMDEEPDDEEDEDGALKLGGMIGLILSIGAMLI